MLEITKSAEDAIRLIREESDFPDSTVLRIAPVPTATGGVAIGFAFTEGPDEGDKPISTKDDFRVYLAQELVEPFERATLEATASDEGVELELRTQADLHENGSHIGSNTA